MLRSESASAASERAPPTANAGGLLTSSLTHEQETSARGRVLVEDAHLACLVLPCRQHPDFLRRRCSRISSRRCSAFVRRRAAEASRMCAASLLECTGGLGTFHVLRLSWQARGHIRLASAARRRTKAEHLRDECASISASRKSGCCLQGSTRSQGAHIPTNTLPPRRRLLLVRQRACKQTTPRSRSVALARLRQLADSERSIAASNS